MVSVHFDTYVYVGIHTKSRDHTVQNFSPSIDAKHNYPNLPKCTAHHIVVIKEQSTAQLNVINKQAMMENDNAVQTVTLVSAIRDCGVQWVGTVQMNSHGSSQCGRTTMLKLR